MESALRRLLRPTSIAIAGVSDKSGSIGALVRDNLLHGGYAGPLHLIHPTRAEIGGRPAVPSPRDLPMGVDCVVLAIPVAGIEQAVADCAANGVGGVVIFAAGFAELGEAGRALQDRIAATARAAGMAIEGPNCLGFVNYVDRIALTFALADPRPPVTTPAIAVLSQSGAMSSVLRAILHARALDVCYTISTGNEATSGIEDFAGFLLDQPHTRVLCLIAEHIRSPRRFLALARRAQAASVPIVMLHPGRSQAARQSAQTHTGAMTGAHDVMLTQVRRAGVIVAETLEELADTAELLARCHHRPHGGAAVLGESGAFKALVLDYADRIGLALPQPQGAAADALNVIAPGFIIASNPLDLTAQALADPSLYAAAAAALTAHAACGSLLVTIILSSAAMAARKMPAVLDLLRAQAPVRCVVFAMLGEDTEIPPALIADIRAAGVPFFRSPERALRALAVLIHAHAATAQTAPVAIDTRRLPPGVMPEYLAKRFLADAGLPTPPGRLCQTAAEAGHAAAAVGYPVALKIQSVALSHKSDIGGVVLNIADQAALNTAWHALMARIHQAAPDAALAGVLVERMSEPGLELILGARGDPDWGPVISVGLGGVLAEAMGDVRILAPDLSAAEVTAELHQLRAAALLGPFRGRPARDTAAVAEAVCAIGRFMRAHPEVTELDINPLMVFADGHGVRALDALMAVA